MWIEAFKRPVILICVALLVFSTIYIPAAPVITDFDEFLPDFDSVCLSDQINANEAYGKLLDFFHDSYPDYYAGAYVDHETGHLTVATKNATETQLRSLQRVLAGYSVTYTDAEYSINELEALRSVIAGIMAAETEPNIFSVGIDETANRVAVFVLNEKEFRKQIGILSGDPLDMIAIKSQEPHKEITLPILY